MISTHADNKPTVALMNTQRGWGGGEKWHFEAACFLHAAGYSVCFVGAAQATLRERISAKKIPYYALSVGNLSFLNPYKIIRLATLLRTVDVLLVNSPADNKLAGLTTLIAPHLKVIFRRGMPHPIKPSLLNRWLFKRAIAGVIANSQSVAASLNERSSTLVAPDKISVIYNGTDFNAYDALAYQPLFARDNHRLTLVSCGRLVAQKNHQLLIAIARLLKQQQIPCRIVIAGDGPLKAPLSDAIAQDSLEEYCLLAGFVSNVKDILACADVFLLPSHYEGSSNALIEACGAGLPALVSDIPSNREIIDDNHNGYLLPLDQASPWVARIIALVNDTQLRQRLGAASQEKARQQFSIKKSRQQLEQLLGACR